MPLYAKRAELERLLAQGWSMSAAARQVGVNRKTAKRWRYGRPVRDRYGRTRHYPPVIAISSTPRTYSPRYLSEDERFQLADLRRQGHSMRAIAMMTGRSASTVSRELRRGVDAAGRYHPHEAHRRALGRRRVTRRSRLAHDLVLREWVQGQLLRRWSPEQVARGLRTQFPDDRSRWLCTESIYLAVYRPELGGLDRRLPGRVLRHRRRRRLPRRDAQHRRSAPVTGMTMITDRPAGVHDRVEAGHWEGDLIMGSANASAVVTLVERTTRYTLLGHIPDSRHDSRTVRDVVISLLLGLPPQLRRTLTWDQGKEMARHTEIADALPGTTIYFCQAHSPWQRPTNEHTNGLLRDYLPKHTDLSVHSFTDIAQVQDQLNERPRRTLDWDSPQTTFARLLKPEKCCDVH